MDAERARAFLLTLPHVEETMQWGESLVFWVGDKAIGGKMFTLISLDGKLGSAVAFAAGAERAAELLEQDGLFPAPYLARAGWVAAEHWGAMQERAWKDEFSAAHERVLARLPGRTRETLAMPVKARKALILERRKLLAARVEQKREERKGK